MAIFVIDEVRRTKIGSPTDKSVLVALANYASEDGSGVYPSIKTIADDTELSRTAVYAAKVRLEERGLIVRTGKRSKGVIEYSIDLAVLRKLPQRKLKKNKCDSDDKGSAGVSESGQQTGKLIQGVREPNPKQFTSRTQTIKEPINTSTTVEKPVGSKKSPFSSLAPELKSAVEIYDMEAKQRNWLPPGASLKNDMVPLLADCIRKAGGINGWKAEVQRAGNSDFLCGRADGRFKNNFTYLLKNFDKLLAGGFDNEGTIVPFKPRSSLEKNASNMGMILRDVAEEFRVEVWKLRSRKFASQFPDAVNLATEHMKQQGIPEAEIKAFMAPQVAA